ncbi:YeaH/YhbH family protein [Natronobiforma cellulositropha]|uniref:YeaH/YhbH family protein n=1 Tax=Natronobiforma cellulositropha TaxID=1679076 RepID=UPI0021D613BD|nr:YeaH/YhbH family protein [Natronobiforma cellulositropha]
MGLREDIERFREVGEERREDLAEFIQYGDLGSGRPDDIQIPVKIVSLPGFEYDRRDQGGVGQGQGGTPDVGQPVGRPQPQPGDEDGDGEEAGEDGGEHEYYQMDPEEFAQELDDALGLELEPKGKRVIEEKEGPYTDLTRSGPDSTLDFERMFKEGLKRKLTMDFDEEFLRELCKVDGITAREAFEYARGQNLPVSMAWIEETHREVADERGAWPSIEAVEESVERETVQQKIRREGLKHVPFRREDERYRYPEIIEEREKNVVVVNIRDVSGSMREKKRELVERTFTPLDWYLTGKYDNAEFVYIAHDADAWQVEREDFFGIRSGGGTKISSAYELAAELLEEYPWSDWNRYVFAAGDSENSSNDTEERVIPLMEEIDANLHAYVETQPSGNAINATHAEELERYFGTDADDVAIAYVNSEDDVTDAIYEILSTEGETNE